MRRHSNAKEPVRQADIVNQIRGRIVRGKLRPGARLPTRVEMANEFDTTVVTVQRALTTLSDDGFVTASGSRGTFVSKTPPHLFHYALVFATHPVEPFPWGRLWQGFANEAATINREGVRKVSCYYDVDGHSDSEDYQKLIRDMKAERVAGLIFASAVPGLVGTPLLEHPGVPRIAFSTHIPSIPVSTLATNPMSFFDRAVEYLAERGRRAPAVFLKSQLNTHEPECDRLLAAIQKHGMRHKPHWFQFVDVLDRHAPQRAVAAVMHREQTDPPDSIIIADDTMLEFASVGLAAMGLRIPQEVEVVGHSNFPWVAPVAVPVKRLGFDLCGIMQACINSIDRQRRGDTEVTHTDFTAQFEHEIQPVPALAPAGGKAALHS